MRTTIWASMIAATLLAGAACKNRDDSAKAMDQAGTTAAKAQEDVNDKTKDVANQQDKTQKDVNNDADQNKLNKDQNNVADQQNQLKMSETDLVQELHHPMFAFGSAQ